ncbi:molybdopterin cofactor-binding domain-containing protein [uncultured Psychroserpens sp.]|uniref:molybdopterin cofactor-binding domain-containing protein n=1 Tax=uncultured Psychroserpens sp. TaxID=255436 RepID=UPI002606DCD6|nr:molybdopterin cofactor-binding domain-containing protein [uncultured Psychroserpens sp.]
MEVSEYKNHLTFYLDGKKRTLFNVSPKMRLIDFLHLPEIGKGGTKIACGQGGCGACTVMLTGYDKVLRRITNRAINACLRPLSSIDGTLITTTQGIGNVKTAVDEIQWTIAANNGSQCGYCTPGFVMNMFTRMQEDSKPNVREVEELFDGNICRCTGYRPILDGFKKLASNYKPPKHIPEIELDPNYKPKAQPHATKINIPKDFAEYMENPDSLHFSQNDYSYFRPTVLPELFGLLDEYGPVGPNLQLMSGNTAVGIYPTKANYNEAYQDPKCIIDISKITELQSVKSTENSLTVGGQITLSRFLNVLENQIEKLEEPLSKGLVALKEHLHKVANLQVRNEATLAGNIFIGTNKGFLSDLVLVLATLEATITVKTSKDTSTVTYPILKLPKASELGKDAIYYAITIPYTKKNDYIKTFKIRRRVEDCHAIVNAGFKVTLDNNEQVVESHFVVNGINASYDDTSEGLKFKPVILSHVSKMLSGMPWNEDTLSNALHLIRDEIGNYEPPKNDCNELLEINQIPFSYRQNLVSSLFYKFFVSVCKQRHIKVSEHIDSLNDNLHDDISSGIQFYNSYEDELPVSAPFVKLSAFMQATGEAIYTSSVLTPPNTLEAAFVYSTISKGTFGYCLPRKEKVSVEELVHFLSDKFSGFTDLITYADIHEDNRLNNWGGAGLDDPLFVPSEDDQIPTLILKKGEDSEVFFPEEITTIGAPLAIVLAKTEALSNTIAEYIRRHCIKYEEQRGIYIDEALQKQHYFPQSPSTNPGLSHIEEMIRPGSDIAILENLERLAHGDTNIEHSFSHGNHATGYQNHFYMETMTGLIIPGENKDMILYSTTQNLADDQSVVASILGIDAADVKVTVQRLGGGFGGRQSRARFIAGPIAIASHKHNCPVRLKMSRETNFIMCGNRHPFYGHFATQFEPSGKITGMVMNYISNGGNTYDLSFPVMDLSVLSGDNAYNIKHLKVTGNVCQTNEISNTAFRAFGLVQSMNILEECIERTAFECGISPEEIRERNFYKDGQVKWTSFQITDWTLSVLEMFGFDKSTLHSLEVLKDVVYKDETELEMAINSHNIEGLIGPSNIDKLITLKDFSTTSYDYTPYLAGLKWNNINQIWTDLKTSSDFEKRKASIEEFNANNKWKKKGISMIPLKYGISFNGPRGALNQGGAYVLVYSGDGSVLVHHGGVEMGQGIQTKMAQIAAEALGIPISYIKMAETNTNIVNNASATAASTGSDLNGGAVQKACLALRNRLEQMCIDLEDNVLYFAEAVEADSQDALKVKTIVRNWRDHWSEVWPLIIEWAYSSRINLSESARYRAPHHDVVDNTDPIGRPFFYFTYSAAVSEVEVDILTGEFETKRTDILFDLGKSLNPLIDVGQLEGAFVQGLGYLTTEEMIKQGPKETPIEGIPKEAITSVNTWDYKPPGTKSIPTDFRISIFDDRLTPQERLDPKLAARAVKSSKGIGEPPLVLANSVFFAIKQAILAFYKEVGHEGWVEMTAPATIPKIQAACHVALDQMTLK